MSLQFLLNYEQELIQKTINSKYLSDDTVLFNISSNDIYERINKDLYNNDSGVVSYIHNKIIVDLIYTYLSKRQLQQIMTNVFECLGLSDFSIIPNVQTEEIPSLCEKLHIAYLNSKFEYKNGYFTRSKSKNNLIEKGAVYTKYSIAKDIVETTLVNAHKSNSDFHNISILDFACGTGRFYESIVKTLAIKYGIPTDESILKHVYAIDIDPVAVNITRLKAINLLDEISEDKIQAVSNHIILRNALIRNNMFLENAEAMRYNDLGGLINAKFGVVVSNPPYLVLKINKNKGDSDLAEKIQKQVSYFRDSGIYRYSIEGMLNYYQLSIEAMLSMTKPKGELGIICPSSLFADVSAKKLRKHLLLKHKVREINYFPEKEQIFENVTQATNIFYLQKSGKTDTIKVKVNDSNFTIDLELVNQLFPEQMEIPFISKTEWGILKKLSSIKKLKQIKSVRNRRGELDLTLFKKYITTDKTPFRLIRGNMISENGIKDINGEYVLKGFIKNKAEDFVNNDFMHERLVCQQISNTGVAKRLKFVFCHETDILGNSCNYLSADKMILKKLSLLLNSSILNWRFKITSTNNHINNYELGELPIADLNKIDGNFKYKNQNQLDEYVGHIYGLNEEEIQLTAQK